MSKVIFFSIPAHGHTNPTLPLVKELVQQGEEVIYYSTETFKEKVIATGAIYKEYKIHEVLLLDQNVAKNLASLYLLLIKVTQLMLDDLLEDIRTIKPDYIIHDGICAWGRYAAAVSFIPAISSISTFAFTNKVISLKKFFMFVHQVKFIGIKHIAKAVMMQYKMFEKYSVRPMGFIETMMNEERLNIVYTSKLMQPGSKYFSDDKYKFIGPSISERHNDPDTTDYSKMKRPLIYISMGTVWKDDFKCDDIIESLSGQDYTLVVSGKSENSLYTGNERIIIKTHINQMEVLKHCDVFITHGGMNSVNESLYWEVPMCLYPFQMEQVENVNRVVEIKCGVRIKKLNSKEIRKAVLKVISNKFYKDNCKKISESFKQSGGYKKAVEQIFKYKQNL